MTQADRVIEGFRLAPQQARLWSLPRAAESYRAQAAWLIDGPLDAHRVRQAVVAVVRRHEILRTKFPSLPGATYPLQVVSQEEDFFAHREADAGGASEGEEHWRAAVERALEAEAGAVFSYEQGPPLRTLLLGLGARRQALVLTLPAACADSHTLHLLMAELGRAYRAAEPAASPSGEHAPEDEAVRYVQVSEWQHETLAELAADGGEEERAYWPSRLRGAAETPALPEQKCFGPACGMTNASKLVRLSGEEFGELEALARRHQTGVETLLLAGWSVLVWRLTRQQRFTLGYLCDGRQYEELRGVAGLLAKWVPLTCELASDYRLDELLQETARVAGEARGRQDYFNWESAAEPDGGTAAGAQGDAPPRQLSLGFQYEERPPADWGAGLEVELLRQRVNTDHLSLYLMCAPEGGGALRVEFHYDEKSFAPAAVETLAEQFLTLLHHAARADASLTVGELELLGERERKRLLYDWNSTAADYPRDKCLHELFAEQAARTPEAAAVVEAGGEVVTYAELNRRANQLAHHLSALGVGPEQRVGVLLERSVEMVVALLGVLKAGGAYVPLETDGAADRLRYMLEDAQVKALLTEERLLRERPLETTARVVCLDTQRADISAAPEHEPDGRVLPDNLVYVIYTSGSTGRPKGTLVTHRGAVNYLHWAAREYAKGRPLDALVHSPIAFDLTVTSLYLPLLVGGRLLLAGQGNGADALVGGLQQTGMEEGLLKLTPAHLEVLRQGAARDSSLRLGRVLVVGGEALFAESLREWRGRQQGLRVINEYGPTETVVGCCVYDASADEAENGPVPIGRPIANSQMYVLDERLRPSPVGVVGELYIGGAGVARGYLHRPGLTAEKFLPHPFADAAGERLYRTGDLGRHLSGGDIEYLGRVDSQVKVRGFRVELGEIEAALLQHPSVREAVVVARADEPPAGDGEAHVLTRLVAYLVADAELSASAWRDALRDKLPDYMIPSAFVTLDEMPLAKNGKVDRRALPAPEQQPARGAGRPPLVPPRNLTEEILASIWAEVLRVEPIGVEDNFFDLGGDSMRSIQIRARAQKRGLNVSHEQIFQHRTISQLARVAGFDGAGEPARSEPFGLVSAEDRRRLPEGLEDAYPLAMLQAGMIFHSEFNPEAAIFHDLHSFHLHARFDVPTMERAVREVSARHPVLRASFELSRFTQPLQLVHAGVAPPLAVGDLRGLSPEEQERAIADWMAADKKQGFVWNEPPLLRFQAHRRADDSFQFTMSFHHAILDGWSAASLLTELFGRYLALLEDEASHADPPLAVSFRDFVALEQAALDSADSKRYWKERLAGVTVSRLPRLRRPQPAGVVPVEVREVVIPAEVSEGLKRLASAASIPVKSVLLAAHLKVMGLLGGVRDVVTGLVYNGRPEETDGERVLGLFLNTLPFRLDLAGGTWRELAESVFEQERDSLPFRRYPLAELQRLGSGQPLFETSFNFMHYYVYQSLGELRDVQLLGYSGYEETNFTLTANFSLDLLSGQVRLGLNYHPTELTPQQVEAYGGYYLSTLTAMAADPESLYHLHTPLSADEQRQLLVEWNQTAAAYTPRGPIQRLVEEQAARTPDAVALVFESSSLTYSELNGRANRLARHLRRLGVGRESRVGVLMERSLEMVVSLLAVLKAGGAYMPLDPQYPAERLAFMLEDGAAAALLTGAGLAGRAEGYAGAVVEVGRWEGEGAEGYAVEDLELEVEAEQLAYVIYTSGSTGRPKGVMNTHGAILNRLLWMQEAYELTAADKVLQKTPFTFDVSVWEFFWPLMFGAQMVVAEPGGHQDARYLAELIAEREVTVVHFVPSMLSLFVEEEGVTDCRSLRQLISSGEALSPQLAARVRERLPRAELDNLYGPTEAAVDVSWWRCERGAEVVPIGRPIANLELHILDGFGQPVPVGVAGELHIGGRGLARGYAGRAGLTAEKFTPHPFATEPGGRLYRTGDLARHLADGNIEYLGRLDHQVKLRGFRIELGEIEQALAQHEGVREVAVVVRTTDAARGPQLIAYFVARPDAAAPAAAELREHLLRKLPDYMIPSHFIALEQLPVTPNGKLAREALPLPEGGAARESSRAYAEPRTETEKALAEIWSEVLGVARVGRDDNFFELGGHSLLATQVISRLRNALQVALPMRALFAAGTVAALAAAVEQQRLAQPSAGTAAEPAAITSQGATDIDKLLEEFEALSSAEVEAMLGEDRAS